eukprot:CAMPEP_0175131156 /NCGR_PEP_ID=MMETSP0087-20121206/6386_1 /TAXON_ID=136419 /ORGANISM="Unknown Unknown, Strain D1" /LENGTH=699 /DNA_ID=CAMNT_0016413415 /DNA_START=118 /DNA_END=2217 /DNA_ORIENTATION=+
MRTATGQYQSLCLEIPVGSKQPNNAKDGSLLDVWDCSVFPPAGQTTTDGRDKWYLTEDGHIQSSLTYSSGPPKCLAFDQYYPKSAGGSVFVKDCSEAEAHMAGSTEWTFNSKSELINKATGLCLEVFVNMNDPNKQYPSNGCATVGDIVDKNGGGGCVDAWNCGQAEENEDNRTIWSVHSLAPGPPTPASTPMTLALEYLGARCDSLVAVGCNPYQLPVYNGQVFAPKRVFVQYDRAVYIDPTQHRSETTSVDLSETAGSNTESVVNGFGISGSVPYQGATFSLGVSHQSLVESMSSYSSLNYYGEMHRQYTTFGAAFTDTPPLTPEFKAAVNVLPANCTSPSDQQAWFSFFSVWGTHYIKSMNFGGVMKLSIFVHSSVSQDAKIQKSDWNFNLGATFDNMAGIAVNFPSDRQKQSYQEMSQYTFNQKFFAVGGDQSIKNYSQWLKTVKSSPAPVQSTLGSFADFFPGSKDFSGALTAYFQVCPHTDSGICNGYGSCNFQESTCKCADGAYLDSADNNCYPQCNCNGHGTCSKGVCQCDVNSDGFGYTGPNCQAKCGTKTYDAGNGRCWDVPNYDGSIMDLGNNNDVCFCRSIIDDSDMNVKSSDDQSFCGFDTYNCPSNDYVCECTFGIEPCHCYQTITCIYGNGDSCSSSSSELAARKLSTPHRILPPRRHRLDQKEVVLTAQKITNVSFDFAQVFA